MNADPIHYNPEPAATDHGIDAPGWYFWDEAQADRLGPFDTREQAEHMLVRYAREVLDGHAPDHDIATCRWCGGTFGNHVNDCR